MATYLKVVNLEEFVSVGKRHMFANSKFIRMDDESQSARRLNFTIYPKIPASGTPPGTFRGNSAGSLITEPDYAALGYTKLDHLDLQTIEMEGSAAGVMANESDYGAYSRSTAMEFVFSVDKVCIVQPYPREMSSFKLAFILVLQPALAA